MWDRERFDRAEVEARRVLTGRVVEGHEGTEPELWREYFEILFEVSGVPSGEVARQVGARLRDEHAREHLWTHVEPGTREALRTLRERGFGVGVVSNADGRMEGALVGAGLREELDFVIDSGLFGRAKPDPAIFLEGARQAGVPPEHCLYVGDLYPVDVVGARGAGMHALLVDPEGHAPWPVERIRAVRELPCHLAGVSSPVR